MNISTFCTVPFLSSIHPFSLHLRSRRRQKHYEIMKLVVYLSHYLTSDRRVAKTFHFMSSGKEQTQAAPLQPSTICQPDDSHTFGRTFGGRPAREATDRRAQREPPWRQKFKLPPLRAERRRYLALVWENYGTRPTRHSRHPGDIPVGLDPQFSMSKKNDGRNPAVNTADRIAVQDALAELLVRLRRKELHYYNFIGNNNDSP